MQHSWACDSNSALSQPVGLHLSICKGCLHT